MAQVSYASAAGMNTAMGGGGGMATSMAPGGMVGGPGGRPLGPGFGNGGNVQVYGPVHGPGGPGGPGGSGGPGGPGGFGGPGGPGGPGGVIVGPGAPGDGCCAPGCAGGPESDANCGGAGAVCCEASGTVVAGSRWHYVGSGGDYAQATSYNYVGQGCGSYTKEVIVTPYGCKLRTCCIALLLGLLLLPFLYWLLNRGGVSPTPLPPTTPCPPKFGEVGKCLVWGDPHCLSFDGVRNDFYSCGEYWVVKSMDIWIQARYLPTHVTSGLSVCKMIAIAGPVLKGHKVFIGPQEATIDGHPILTTFPSSFRTPDGVIDMQYNGQGTVLQEGREGKALHVIHIRIQDGSPQGLMIQVNRWNEPGEGSYINVQIIMARRLSGQDGHCGNFNGNPADDDRLMIRQRLGRTGVPPGELLFDTKTPVVSPGHPDINDCPTARTTHCREACRAHEKKFIPSKHCMIDCCFGGDQFVTEG